MELPRALIPWAASLDLFPREIVGALGPMIRRIDLAIGPLRVHGRHDTGDPDGYDGISHHGHYDRLLISEWLLAEEFPDEFLRRAVMREQGFLKMAHREPVGSRHSVVLCDAGPNQLGAPRIAQLAALIVLARRAEAAGADFHWTVLQKNLDFDPGALTPSSIIRFLQARSDWEIDDAGIALWRDAVDSEIDSDDVWFLGGSRLAALPSTAGASLLQITDPLEPDTRSLAVTIVDQGRAKPPLTLELPEAPLCAKLLRDPFAVRTAAPHQRKGSDTAPTSDLIFTWDHSKLMARSGSDCLIVHPVPGSTIGGLGKAKIYTATLSRPILAAGRVGKSTALVTLVQKPDMLSIECHGPKSDRLPPVTFLTPKGLPAPAETDRFTPCFYRNGVGLDQPWLVQLGTTLLRPQSPPQPGSEPDPVDYAEVVLENILASRVTYRGCVFVSSQQGRGVLTLFDHTGDIRTEVPAREPLNRAEFGCAYYEGLPEYGLLLLEGEGGAWYLTRQGQEHTFHPPSSGKVVGCGMLDGKEAGLIVLEPGSRCLHFVAESQTTMLHQASAEIDRVAVSIYAPHIVYFTVRGEMVVYSLLQQQVLYRVERGASA